MLIRLVNLRTHGTYESVSKTMKKAIHPEFYDDAKITCACGTVYEVGSTEQEIDVELCAACHPFYTGEQKIIDTARRVEKFKARSALKTTKISQLHVAS